MRHPFWKWTGWLGLLSVGLSGCLHGQDWRAAVSNPLTRPVADRRESAPIPKVIGPRRKDQTPFVPPNSIPAPIVFAPPLPHAPASAVSGPRSLPSKPSPPSIGHVTPSAIGVRPPAMTASDVNRTSRSSSEAIQPPTTQDEAQPRGTKVVEAEFVPPPAPPATPATDLLPAPTPVAQAVHAPPSPAAKQTPTPGGYAEFERSIPRRIQKVDIPQPFAPPAEDDEIVIVPKAEPRTPPSLPLIVPAGRVVPIRQLDAPQSLLAEPPKELPDVSDIITTEPGSSNADLERVARPRDVAVLVEQVFEDLRQRRLDQARQRTAWLKQIVTRRELAVEEALSPKPVSVPKEPQRLHLDPQAVPLEKALPD